MTFSAAAALTMIKGQVSNALTGTLETEQAEPDAASSLTQSLTGEAGAEASFAGSLENLIRLTESDESTQEPAGPQGPDVSETFSTASPSMAPPAVTEDQLPAELPQPVLETRPNHYDHQKTISTAGPQDAANTDRPIPSSTIPTRPEGPTKVPEPEMPRASASSAPPAAQPRDAAPDTVNASGTQIAAQRASTEGSQRRPAPESHSPLPQTGHSPGYKMASEKIATQNTIATRPDAAAIEPAARDSITLADLPNNSRLSVVTDRQEVTAPTPRAERNLSQNISGQIAQVVGRADAARTEIRLDPPELGRVTVTLQADGDSISAQISSERPEIAEMLRRHNDMLHRELTNAGFRNVSLDFGQPGQGDGGFERPSGPQAGESDVQPGPDDKDSARERSADAAASGLDLRV